MSNQNRYFFLLVVIMLSSIGLLATDIYLPALPEMAAYFNCSQTDIQKSFTVFLMGLAGCQLLVGMLVDRYGQKRIALIGFTLFTLASLLCAYATTLPEFILSRFFQAIGAGVGSVIGRAIVVERYPREEAAKVFSTTFPVVGLSSAVAPLVGGYLTYFLGWRSTFFFMVGYGVILLMFVMNTFKNRTKVRELIEEKIHFASRMQGFFGMFRNVEFVGYALIICAGFAVFRSYTVESPFVFNNQGYGAEEIGHFYITLALAYLFGNLTAKKLLNKMRMRKVLRIGFVFFVLGGGILVLSSLLYSENPWAVIVPMALVTFGNGFLFPIGTAGAMTAVSSQYTGRASGLMGALQFMLAAFAISWVGEICHGQGILLSLFIGSIIVIGWLSYLLLIVSRPKVQIPAN